MGSVVNFKADRPHMFMSDFNHIGRLQHWPGFCSNLRLPNDGHTDTNGGNLNGDHVNDDRPEEQC